MVRLDGYMAGCNLGHWISQYGRKGAEHFGTYITEPDFRRMKAYWKRTERPQKVPIR